VIYDLSGPLAACSVGAHVAIDLTNEKGGVLGKHKVEAVSGDGQRKVDVAIKMMVGNGAGYSYQKQTGEKDVPPHCSMGFNQTWLLLEKVLPIAIEKYGGTDPEAVRKAALDIDILPGGTIQGYGVKFYPPGSPMAGQNERSTPVVMQYIPGQPTAVAWPKLIQTHEPVLPLPKSSPYAIS